MIAFYDEMVSSEDEGRAVDIVYLNISNAFYTASHNNPYKQTDEIQTR